MAFTARRTCWRPPSDHLRRQAHVTADGWIGLYTANGSVEDPVGSRPHVGDGGDRPLL